MQYLYDKINSFFVMIKKKRKKIKLKRQCINNTIFMMILVDIINRKIKYIHFGSKDFYSARLNYFIDEIMSNSNPYQQLIRLFLADEYYFSKYEDLETSENLSYTLQYRQENDELFKKIEILIHKISSKYCIFNIRDICVDSKKKNSGDLDALKMKKGKEILENIFPEFLIQDLFKDVVSKDISLPSQKSVESSISPKYSKENNQIIFSKNSTFEKEESCDNNQLHSEKLIIRVKDRSHTPKNSFHQIRTSSQFEDHIQYFQDVTLLFLDIVGFTKIASVISSKETMIILNKLYNTFDLLTEKHKVYKVETAGDCYIVCDGIFQDDEFPLKLREDQKNHKRNFTPKQSCEKILNFAINMINETRALKINNSNVSLKIRIGLHIGDVVGGYIGMKLPKFSLFGDDMNIASRMESTSKENCIQVTKRFYEYVSDKMTWEKHEEVEIKNRGKMETYITSV